MKKIHKIISLALALSMLFSLTIVTAGAAGEDGPVISVSAASDKLTAGNSCTFTASIAGNTGFDAMGLVYQIKDSAGNDVSSQFTHADPDDATQDLWYEYKALLDIRQHQDQTAGNTIMWLHTTQNVTNDGELFSITLTPDKTKLLNGTYTIQMNLAPKENSTEPNPNNFAVDKAPVAVSFMPFTFTLEGGQDPSKLAPTITTQPVGATYTYQSGGVEATALIVEATPAATATGDVTYQWYSNTTDSNQGGTAIPNETNATYTPTVTTFGTTYYYCVVSNVVGGETYTATSDVVAVTYAKAEITELTLNKTTTAYTGAEQSVTATVKSGDAKLTAGTDYTISGDKATAVGEYTVRVNGTGNYTGTKTATWTITPADITASDKTVNVYNNGKAFSIAPEYELAGGATTGATITYELTSGSDLVTLDAANGTLTGKGAGTGTATVQATIKAANHNDKVVTITANVSNKQALPDGVLTFAKKADAVNPTYSKAGTAVSDLVEAATVTGTYNGKITYTLTKGDTAIKTNVEFRELGNVVEAGDYKLTAAYEDDTYVGSAELTITVNKKPVTATVTAADKVYDGTTTATVKAEVTSGLETGDTITITGLTGVFADANFGTDKAVTVNTTNATITGTGSENYVVSYSDNVTANITAKAFSDSTTIAAIADQAYTGSAITPEPEVKDGDAVLVKDHDYNLTYENNENAGTATVKVTGTGNYSGEKTATFTITAKALESVAISSSETDGSVKAGSTLTAKVLPVVTADDVTYQWFVGTEEIADATTETFEVPAGTADGTMVKVVVKGDGNYSGTVEAEVETGKIALGSATVTIAQDANLVYTGSAVEPAFTVTINGTEVAAANYTATFSNNVNAGTASIILTAANDAYSGTATATFEIAPAPITGAIVAAASDQNLAYNGRAQVVNVAVTLGDKTLVMGTDFTVTGNIVETVGEHELTVTVTGKGNYTGTINDAPITVTVAKGTPTGTPAYTTINTSGKTLADAALAIGSITPAGGTIKWVDAEGNALADTTEVTANTQYKWLYTPLDSNYDTLSGTVTLWTQGGSTGGNTGGGTGGGGSNTTTTTNPDGSTTTTKTDKKTGTVTETTKYPDGSTTVVETKKDGSSQTKVDKKDGSTSTTTVDTKGQVVADVKLSDKAVKDAGEGAVALPMPEVPVTTSHETAPTVTVNLPSGSKDVKVEIPVKNVTPGTVAILVKADGTEEIVKTSVITANGVAVKLNNGDTVKIVDNSKKFTDVADSHWGKDAIAFASSHELFNGTSETTFSPDEPMTRGMLMTVLARFDGANTEGGDPWYQKGMEWAVANGVSDGTNPEANLTREQMITMIWRYTGSPASEGSIDSFADASSVNVWAQDAMKWAVSTGLVKGTGDNALSPKDGATRAMVATLFMRYVELMAK